MQINKQTKGKKETELFSLIIFANVEKKNEHYKHVILYSNLLPSPKKWVNIKTLIP